MTYDELTVIPAQVLGVVVPFLENSPAETLGQAALWENIGRAKMTPIYEFIDADGEMVGCGTEAELAHWTAEGVMVGVRLGERVA